MAWEVEAFLRAHRFWHSLEEGGHKQLIFWGPDFAKYPPQKTKMSSITPQNKYSKFNQICRGRRNPDLANPYSEGTQSLLIAKWWERGTLILFPPPPQ